jgi:uncharacterized protein YukE
MTTFTVNPATLEALSGKLSAIHSSMDGMSSLVSIPRGLLGGSDIEGTLNDACNHWHYGTKKLADHMKGVVQRLDAAAQTYNESEDAVQAACGKSK